MKKIYLSGPISGRHTLEYLSHFNSCEKKLKGTYEVINPTKIKHKPPHTWENYMKRDLKSMLECDTIYLLTGWEHSNGARIEFNLAKELGMIIIFE
jgi:hypothetical protein